MRTSASIDDHSWPFHQVAMPIDIGGVRGVTRHVGVRGVVFDSPASFEVGSNIAFVISTVAEPHAPLRLECRGVVTSEEAGAGGGFVTAATIDEIHVASISKVIQT